MLVDTNGTLTKICNKEGSKDELIALKKGAVKALSRSSLEIRCAAAILPHEALVWTAISVVLFIALVANVLTSAAPQKSDTEHKKKA